MKEIEVKILEINKEEVIQKLKDLGAKETFNDIMEATYYTDGTFKEKGMLLRLRKEGNRTILTFKKKLSKEKTKIMEELEVEVKNIEEMKKILLKLGLKEFLRIKKERIQYDLDDVHCAIDTYKKNWSVVPTFLEIEGPTEEKIFSVAKKLGFSEEDCKPMGGREIYEHYLKLTS